jgi:hypothetical protein
VGEMGICDEYDDVATYLLRYQRTAPVQLELSKVLFLPNELKVSQDD